MNYDEIQGMRVSEIKALAVNSYDSILSELIEPRPITDPLRLGSVIHAIILQDNMDNMPSNIKILDYDNWRTKDAQKAKKEYEATQEIIPVLSNEFETIQRMINSVKSHLIDIFGGGEYERAHIGELENFGAIKGRLDCLKDDCVMDLKCTAQLTNLDKKIFDMGYQLQMYLYMLLSNKSKAKLVFLHTKTGLIEVKHLELKAIEPECEILLKRAWANKQKLDLYKAFKEIEVNDSDYIPPQWALSELLNWESN